MKTTTVIVFQIKMSALALDYVNISLYDQTGNDDPVLKLKQGTTIRC